MIFNINYYFLQEIRRDPKSNVTVEVDRNTHNHFVGVSTLSVYIHTTDPPKSYSQISSVSLRLSKVQTLHHSKEESFE
jgi:hypothetical protein